MSRAKGKPSLLVGRRIRTLLRLVTVGATASGAACSTWIVNADSPGAAVVLAAMAALNVSKLLLDSTAPRDGRAHSSEDSSGDQ